MKFEEVSFSKRYPPILCNVVTIHEKPRVASYGVLDCGFVQTVDVNFRRGTAVAIVLPDGAMFVGVALCAAGDNFVKAIGRQVALGRAVQAVYRETVPASIGRVYLDSSKKKFHSFNQPIQPNGWIRPEFEECDCGIEPKCSRGDEKSPMPQIIEILQREINEARERSLANVKYF